MKYIESVKVDGNVYEINQVTAVDKYYGFQTRFTVNIDEKTYDLRSVVDSDVLDAFKFASCFDKNVSDVESFVRNELQYVLSVEIARDISNIIYHKEIHNG
jgi:hypothetical protein